MCSGILFLRWRCKLQRQWDRILRWNLRNFIERLDELHKLHGGELLRLVWAHGGYRRMRIRLL